MELGEPAAPVATEPGLGEAPTPPPTPAYLRTDAPSAPSHTPPLPAGSLPTPGSTPIGSVTFRQRTRVSGRVTSVRTSPIAGSPALSAELYDSTGGITVVFYGRRAISGIEPGAHLEVEGCVGELDGHLAIANPLYEIHQPTS